MTKDKYLNGYSDGSGKGTITLNGVSVLKTHWGCSCCDYGPTAENIQLADKIVDFMNKNKFKIGKLEKK